MDYQENSTWERLAHLLARVHVPQPTANSGRVVCEPGWYWEPAPFDYVLWLVLTGRVRAYINGVDCALRPGSLVVFRPGDVGDFRQLPGDPLTVVWCHFDFVDPATREPVDVDQAWLPSRHIVLRDVAGLSDLLQRVVRLSRDPNPLRRTEATFVLSSALIEVYQQDAWAHGEPSGYVHPGLRAVMEHIRTRPGRRPTLQEAAAVADLAPAYLSRLFIRQLGTTFRGYVLQARLERAHLLLSETTMTVSQVAHRLGYRDVSLFSRQFHRRYGQPPSQLRRRPT